MVFGEATNISISMPDPIDGILGMGWPGVVNNNMSIVFQQMIDQGVVDAPVFGFYLNTQVLCSIHVLHFTTCKNALHALQLVTDIDTPAHTLGT